MKKILGRIVIVTPAIVLQFFWYALLFGVLDNLLNQRVWGVLNAVLSILAFLFVTNLVAKRDESSYKLLWVIVITAMPILGALLYLMLGNKGTGKRLQKKLDQSADTLPQLSWEAHGDILSGIQEEDLRMGQTLGRIADTTGFPVLKNGDTRFYPFGENMFRDMCEDLRTAKKFIYIEYFIIESGKFWDTLTDILAERAAAGVDVRVMYDDLGSIHTYSVANIADLSRKGIKCMPFNPFLFVKPQLNNRDHRKIMVIDGTVAYSGGINLADEYINAVQKYGRWKDIGFRIAGKAASSYTYMFAEFWNAFSWDKLSADCLQQPEPEAAMPQPCNGAVLSYYDSPMHPEHVSNELFTEMLSIATDYIWFYTPYLMLGDTLFEAFLRAAKRGVDVRIVTPGIPDMKLVHRLSRSYYPDLIDAGVKIYEYQPGFVHAKGFVADDRIAGIGTVNLDYRSLFLHFECNSVFYKADIVADMKQDFLETMAACKQQSPADVKKGPLPQLVDHILRIAAPLM